LKYRKYKTRQNGNWHLVGIHDQKVHAEMSLAPGNNQYRHGVFAALPPKIEWQMVLSEIPE
jgi:hypothetical protein